MHAGSMLQQGLISSFFCRSYNILQYTWVTDRKELNDVVNHAFWRNYSNINYDLDLSYGLLRTELC